MPCPRSYYIESEGEAVRLIRFGWSKALCWKKQHVTMLRSNMFWNTFPCRFCKRPSGSWQKKQTTIVYGSNCQAGFEAHVAADGEEIKVGKNFFKVLHTGTYHGIYLLPSERWNRKRGSHFHWRHVVHWRCGPSRFGTESNCRINTG